MEVSAAVLAECLDMTERRVQQLAKKEITVKVRRGKYDLAASVKNYIDYMTEDGKTSEERKYDDIRAEHEVVKMRKTELTVARMEGKLHRSVDVKRLWTNMAATVKTRLLGIPVKLAPQITGMSDTAKIQELLQQEVTDALNEVSGYDPAAYDEFGDEYDEDEESETE